MKKRMIDGEIMEYSENLEKAVSLTITSAEKRALVKAVFSKPCDKENLRAVAAVKNIGGKDVIQVETFRSDNKALHENIGICDHAKLCALFSGYMQVNLITTSGDCEYRRSKSGNDTVIGGDKLMKALTLGGVKKVDVSGNDHEKKRILCGNEDFLKLLGVSDANGRVYDKKQPKFRQINRFLELVRDTLPYLPDGELRICDLCCGKSYLSFAIYYYFSKILGREVRMTGVDLKTDVIAYCSDVAGKLGYDGLEFLAGDVGKYETAGKVNLVVSLHACDTATDLVLGKAIAWDADVVLSTPCCHHELNHTLDCPSLGFIAEHSMLRQKFCDAATDAMRLKLLEANGYDVAALELIDPEETPKNIMLRGLKNRKSVRDRDALMKEYREIRRFLGYKDLI